MTKKKTWSDLSPTQKKVIGVAGAVEAVMTLVALRDLGRRPAAEVRGPRTAWRLAVLVQPVGPVAYFAVGRR